MLPDFRFLFAAVVVSVSVVAFGLGAAALLRASHEQFVALPAWRAPPEVLFARQLEAGAPTLAMLNVDIRTAEPEEAQQNSIENTTIAPPPATVQAAEADAPGPEAERTMETLPDPALPAPEPAGAATTNTALGRSPDQTIDAVESKTTLEAELLARSAPTSAAPPVDPIPIHVTAISATPPEPADSQASAQVVQVEPAAAPEVQPTSETTTTAAMNAAPADGLARPTEATLSAASEPPSTDPLPEASAQPVDAPVATEMVIAAPAILPIAQPATGVDASVRTASLDPQTREIAAAAAAPVSIEGSIPLPRSRKINRSRTRPHRHALLKRRKVAARLVRPHVVRRPPPAARAPIRPQAQHPPFLFGE